MPPSASSVHQIRLNSVISCLTALVQTLEILNNSFRTPFLLPIVCTTRSLVNLVETVKQNTNKCTLLLEQVTQLLYALITLHTQADFAGDLNPSILSHVGSFARTLHKIHTFVQEQRDGNRVRRFLHQGQISALFKDCEDGLQQAFDAFKIQTVDFLRYDLHVLKQQAEERHEEVLNLIASLSDTNTLGSKSSLAGLSSFADSSTSITMLPSKPKIFHGRSEELSHILDLFRQGVPRISILGGGGMGKTTLAQVVLHHPDITLKYGENRFFVPCDSVATQAELPILIGAHIGLSSGRDPSKVIIQHLSKSPPSLLILDNLETVWEPQSTREETEGTLSLLADIQHLAIIITMRGSERPAQVFWTHPFLSPLRPLAEDASRKIFTDIADDIHDKDDMSQLLLLTDNVPLAVDLMAHLADSEGCPAVLSRWEAEKTGLISEGNDKRSNMDMSIALSLSSPRLLSAPGAKELLSLLSMLPDGLSDTELMHSNLGMNHVLKCKAVLLRTSLAYTTPQMRLKVLVPVQEYMQKHHAPQPQLVEPLFQNYVKILELSDRHQGAIATELTSRIAANLSNIQKTISYRMQQTHLDQSTPIYCAIKLDRWSRFTSQRVLPLMEQVSHSLPRPIDYKLEVSFIAEYLMHHIFRRIPDPEAMIERALKYLPYVDDSELRCQFYRNAGHYYTTVPDYDGAIELFQKALTLSIATGNTHEQCGALMFLANAESGRGNCALAHAYARDAQKPARIGGHLYREAVALGIEAENLAKLANYPQGIVQCEKALSALNLCGMSGQGLHVVTLSTLATIHHRKSEYLQAREVQIKILQLLSAERETVGYAEFCLQTAALDIAMNTDLEEAQRNLDRARHIYTSAGWKFDLANCDIAQADLHLRNGNISAAHRLLTDTLAANWGKFADVTMDCLERLGRNTMGHVNGDGEYPWPVIFLAQARKAKMMRETYLALQLLGSVSFKLGDQSTAIALLSVACDAFTCMDIHQSKAECMLQLGDIAKMNGNTDEAERLWRAAQPFFERSSQRSQVAAIEERLLPIQQSGSS